RHCVGFAYKLPGLVATALWAVFQPPQPSLLLQTAHRPVATTQPATVNASSSSSFAAFSKFMMQCLNCSHCFFPITSPPSAVNFTAISSSVIGSRGSPFGTSTRVEYSLPSFVVIVTRLG